MTEPIAPLIPTPTPSPLAEGRWLWRRIYVFSISLGLWKLLADVVRTATPEALPHISDGLIALLALLLLLYLVAPTAQQLVALMAEMKLRLGGIASGLKVDR
ncbi:MAG TPA: hypothetical protein VF633_14750 [Brevundimonas sp.]|jgi:hypothetical protein